LDSLKAECVKATFFVVGVMAQGAPQHLKRAFEEGHSIGTHTQHHLFNLPSRPQPIVHDEINNGIASIAAILGDRKAVAPFFRFPALNRSVALENYAASQGLMVWSSDINAEDWLPSSPGRMTNRVLSRLEARPSGIVTFHDIQARTAAALPTILHELKQRGFRVVHVRPSDETPVAAN
jgi:peptidoglycan-N-acetylglucosamine deacetylase